MRTVRIAETDPNYVRNFSSFLVQLGAKPLPGGAFEVPDGVDLSAYHGLHECRARSWADEHPAEATFIKAYQGNSSFLLSLADQLRRKGELSPRQTECLSRAVAEASRAPAPKVGDVAGIAEFVRRNNKAKFPKVRILAGDRALVLSLAGAQSRNAGCVNVKDMTRADSWLGKVTLDGRFEPSRSCSDQEAAEIAAALSELAARPAEAAAEYGRRTGSCCFCGTSLEDARSVSVGYGPVCAENYGLPWGGA